MPTVRTLLILGRVSNLPTVWSNCLAGWWLAGCGNTAKLPFLFVGVTLLYVGGMFLNDAFDADFDQQYRQVRPIPSGAISLQSVWRWGTVWLGLGSFSLIWLGPATGLPAIALLLCILAYDAFHKLTRFAPLLMGACRFWVYVIAASAGENGVSGRAVWCGLALSAYVVGLSFVARGESTVKTIAWWPFSLLAIPVILAQIMNSGPYRESALLLSIVLVLWIAKSVRKAFVPGERNVGGVVAGLLAGIVLVDLLAVADVPRAYGVAFLLLFVAALAAQRVVPAT